MFLAEKFDELTQKYGNKFLYGVIVGCVVLTIAAAIGVYFLAVNKDAIGIVASGFVYIIVIAAVIFSFGIINMSLRALDMESHSASFENDKWQIDFDEKLGKRVPGYDRRIDDPGFEARYAEHVKQDVAKWREKSLKELEAERAAREVYDRQQNPHGY